MKSSRLTQAMVVCRKELTDWSRDRRSIMTVLILSSCPVAIQLISEPSVQNRSLLRQSDAGFLAYW